MNLISEDKYIHIDRRENNKSFTELKNEFHIKYKQILQIKDNPSSDAYHTLYDQLWDLYNQIVKSVRG